MLMVRSSRHRFTAEMIPLYSYAFLGEHTNSFDEGNEIYNKLNSIYSKQYPYFDLPDSYQDVTDVGQKEALEDHFFKGSVIFVSSDGKRVLLQSRLFEGTLKRMMSRDDNPYQSAPYIYDFFGSVFDLNGFIIYDDIIINYIEKNEKI